MTKRIFDNFRIKFFNINNLQTVITTILTLVLLYFVIKKVGLADLVSTLKQADLYLVLLSLILAPVILATGVIKWKILLDSRNIHVPFWRLYGLYLVGKFFNNFLPSNVGGDLMRAYELGIYTGNGSLAMASIFVERITGFMVLVFMALLSFVFHPQIISDVRLISAMTFAITVLLLMLWLILDHRPLEMITRRVNFSLIHKFSPRIRKFHASLYEYRTYRRALSFSVLWSFVFMVLAILNVYISAMAFHKPISFIHMFVIVPIILVVSMIPITINGLGLQELTYVLLFSLIGLPGSVGLSTILLIRGKEILFSITGGVIYPLIKMSNSSNASS